MVMFECSECDCLLHVRDKDMERVNFCIECGRRTMTPQTRKGRVEE